MAVKTRTTTSRKGTGPWGSTTQLIIGAIQNGANTLGAIAQVTGIEYRKVNAYVYALECQERVVAKDYVCKRGEQVFTVLRAERRSSDCNARRHHPSDWRSALSQLDQAWNNLSSNQNHLKNTASLPTITHKCMTE